MESTGTNGRNIETSQEQVSEISFSDISLNNSKRSEFNVSEDDSTNIHKNARDELIEELMVLCLRHNLTKIAVEDVAKLINKVPGATVEIPTTKYLL